MPLQDYYHVLGIPLSATGEEIKQAYKAMALKWHPDRHMDGTEDATRRFLEVQEAYQALMREHYQYLDSAGASSVGQRTESISTYKTGTYFSGSTSTVGSVIHISTSSVDSLATPDSTSKSDTSSQITYPSHLYYGARGPSEDPRAPSYAHDDHSPSAYSKHFGQHLGRLRGRHSSENLRRHPGTWVNYTPPTLHKHGSNHQPRDSTHFRSRSFTILPPTRRERTTPLSTATTPWDQYGIHGRYESVPLRSLGIGPSGEWVYALSLTLEELLNGKHCCFSLSRKLASGKSKNVVLEAEIPPGCREGTRILCRGVGHERFDGTRQDIAFIIEEQPHQHFSRTYDDLLLDVTIPWEGSRYHEGDLVVEGLDGKRQCFRIDYPRDRTLRGRYIVKGAGMPIRQGGRVVGKGNLVIRWEIVPQQSKLFNFMRRFMKFRR